MSAMAKRRPPTDSEELDDILGAIAGPAADSPPPTHGQDTLAGRHNFSWRGLDRVGLSEKLVNNLILPGLDDACRIFLKAMRGEDEVEGDVRLAATLIALTKEMVLRGFPQPGPRERAAQLLWELERNRQQKGEGGKPDQDRHNR